MTELEKYKKALEIASKEYMRECPPKFDRQTYCAKYHGTCAKCWSEYFLKQAEINKK